MEYRSVIFLEFVISHLENMYLLAALTICSLDSVCIPTHREDCLHNKLRNQRPHPQTYYFYCSKKAEFARGRPPLLLSGVDTVSHPLTEPGVIGGIPEKSVEITPPLPTRTRIGGGTCLATREAGPLLTARAFGGSPSPRPVPAIGIWIPGAEFCAFLRL